MSKQWNLAALSPQRRQAMEFLRDHLPASDLDNYPFGLFLEFADHALFLRERDPACGALDWDVFAHYVLFPRVNDEDLSPHRKLFYDALSPRLEGAEGGEARVLAVNRWCHEYASYQAQDERTASPLTVFRCGSGRCGELSAFLVSALRSVGIPARQVYVPRWSHCDDNHAWVEALCGGVWRFFGACEPEPVADRGWFNTAASRAMLVHSRLFGQGNSPLHGQPLGREGIVTWYNQTARYAPVRKYVLRAVAGGAPAAGARLELQVLNEARLQTIAVLIADSRGTARVELGLGDLHVLALWNGLTAEGLCTGGTVTLELRRPQAVDTGWTELDFSAPAAAELRPAALTPAQKTERAQTLAQGNDLRVRRLAGYYDEAQAAALPDCQDLLRAARGNFGELLRFLSGPDRPTRIRLARTLAEKDLRDTPAQVLEDHLQNLPPRREEVPEEVYWRYAACPRIALEKLSPWRGPLKDALGPLRSPADLKGWLRHRLAVRDDADHFRPLYWTPQAALKAGGCDLKSAALLRVAALRTLGVPARMRPLDGAPEVWRDGSFHPLHPEETGRLCLVWTETDPPLYRQNWSLSRWTRAGWLPLSLSDEGWAAGERTLELPAGYYRLLTAARLPNGNQLASRLDLPVAAGQAARLRLALRSCPLSELLRCQTMPAAPAAALDGTAVPDLFRLNGQPSLLLWLEEGSEPTEHLLGELDARREELDALAVNVVFLLRGADCASQPTLAGVLARWPAVRVLLDDWAYDLEDAARRLTCDPDAAPLAVVCDGRGRAVYAHGGYRVGLADLLVRVAAHLCG